MLHMSKHASNTELTNATQGLDLMSKPLGAFCILEKAKDYYDPIEEK